MAENKTKKSGNGIGIGAALGVAFGAIFDFVIKKN